MEQILVSILCMTYNQEKYIKKCLNGFVSQKTNFRYEIVIHDDCSTDRTRNIISEYANKYPQLFLTQFEVTNMLSKGVNILDDIMLPAASGKYIALCEGDDYWSDENKLQKQFDLMESDPSISLCAHNTIIHDLNGEKADYYFNNWNRVHVLSSKEAFFQWCIHTSSYFYRRNVCTYPKNIAPVWCGDYARLLLALSHGTVVCLPEIMSVYNSNNREGITWETRDLRKLVNNENERMNFLEEYDKYTNGIYHNDCADKIAEITFYNNWNKIACDLLEDNYYTYKKYFESIQSIKNNRICERYFKRLSIIDKIKWEIKYIFGYFYYKNKSRKLQ